MCLVYIINTNSHKKSKSISINYLNIPATIVRNNHEKKEKFYHWALLLQNQKNRSHDYIDTVYLPARNPCC